MHSQDSRHHATHDPAASSQPGEPLGSHDAESFTGPEKTPSLSEVWSLLQAALGAKQAVLLSQLNVVEAEAKVLRQSVIVSGLSILAAFVFACCVWLVLNAGLTVTLISYTRVSPPMIALLLLLLNVLGCVLAIMNAKSALRHLTLMPLAKSIIGKVAKER